MPVAYLNQGVRKDLTEAKRMNEVKSEAEGVRVLYFIYIIYPIASGPSSPVLILIHPGKSRTKIFPSPILPV